MGKSDPIIFNEYLTLLDQHCGLRYDSIAFLGFGQENAFTTMLQAPVRDFYDLSLGNWDINDTWVLPKSYDLVISTRCPYFARDPHDFVERCRASLAPGGTIFLDWGLGDHWRFDRFKVGWVRDGEHEFAYAPDNFLHSCFWRPEFVDDLEVKRFWSNVQGRFGYQRTESLNDIIRVEVPSIIDYGCKEIRFKFLWPEAPQLYIMTLITREE